MAELASDDFTRADDTNLGANWDDNTAVAADGFSIVSNAVAPTSIFSDASETNNSVTWPNDQYSEVTFDATAANGVGAGCGPTCREATAANTMYRAAGNASGYELGRIVAGTFTSLSTGAGTTFASTDRLKLQTVTNGANCDWTLFKNDVSFASGTDTSPIASGRAGIVYSSTDAGTTIASWRGGDVAAAGGSSLLKKMRRYF